MKMLIIFDVDGTLVGGEPADWRAFDESIATVLGGTLDAAFFSTLDEITAQAIAEASIRKAGKETGKGLEERIAEGYLEGLKAAHATNPGTFYARSNAIRLLSHLRTMPGVDVAIATGDWLPTISFKLAAAGFDTRGIPIATSSDRYSRSDIIGLAAERAGRSLDDALYVGDGVWDYKATRKLSIPFIGTGKRTPLLQESGAVHLHPEFDPEGFVPLARQALEGSDRRARRAG